MTLLALLIYLVLGAIAGFAAGLLGIGGGVVIVAALAFLLPGAGVPADAVMHVALATSLASIIATSLSSTRAHWRRGAVMWPSFARLAPGLVVGAAFGALIADALSATWLRYGFAAFCVVLAAQMSFSRAPPTPTAARVPASPALLPWGVGIGVASALTGIGGGSLTVPLLVAYGASMVRAVGTSAACGFMIAVASAGAFAAVGQDADALPSGTVGYVYVPAALAIAATSVWLAPVGAAMAHRLRGHTLKRVFAAFLTLIAIALVLAAPR